MERLELSGVDEGAVRVLSHSTTMVVLERGAKGELPTWIVCFEELLRLADARRHIAVVDISGGGQL